MAVNKDSNIYTFLFAIILVVVVGAGLAALSVGLKPAQQANVKIKNKMDILGAIKIDATRKNADELYAKYIVVDECIVIDIDGNVTGKNVDDIDIKKQYRDKTLDPSKRDFPLYVANIDGSTKYIMPMVGNGLWGPIWGYVAVNDDKNSVFGATFFHKGETPGLGAEISNKVLFSNQFEGEELLEDGSYKKIVVAKDGSGKTIQHKVDGITGGTITSKGVEEMLHRTLQVYVNYFTK